MHLSYSKNIAIKTKTPITATVPHNTNFVKLFQVFLWFSLSIKNYFCLALNFGLVLFITYTRPLLLTSLELRSLFLIDLSELFIFIIFNLNKRSYVIFQIYFSIFINYFTIIGYFG